MRHPRFGVVLALAVLTGCATEQRAERALQASEDAITAQHADAIRYAPDTFKDIMDTYAAARTAFEAKDYATAMAGANDAAAKAKQLPTAIAAGKATFTARWDTVSANVSMKLLALEKQVAALSSARKLPPGVVRGDVAAARDEFPQLQDSWQKARAAVQRGDLSDAVHAASQVETRASTWLQKLGMQPGHAMTM
ncbi:MAG: hypothetical protein OER21_00300 [Gemmatimonadota bacterium]|nr:hypothetical protein [Gemmatimonadota bacterium]